jgi:hypothetical protein
MLFITLSLCALGLAGVAKAAQLALARFDLDLMTALLWLGLAERPVGVRPERFGVRD